MNCKHQHFPVFLHFFVFTFSPLVFFTLSLLSHFPLFPLFPLFHFFTFLLFFHLCVSFSSPFFFSPPFSLFFPFSLHSFLNVSFCSLFIFPCFHHFPFFSFFLFSFFFPLFVFFFPCPLVFPLRVCSLLSVPPSCLSPSLSLPSCSPCLFSLFPLFPFFFFMGAQNLIFLGSISRFLETNLMNIFFRAVRLGRSGRWYPVEASFPLFSLLLAYLKMSGSTSC